MIAAVRDRVARVWHRIGSRRAGVWARGGDVALVFVAQRGDIEPKSLLLAASLRRHLGPGCALVAVVPEMFGEVRAPSAAALAALAALGVEVVQVRNACCVPGASERVGDGHINKAWCLTAATPRRRVVVIDSDVLCLRRPDARVLEDDAALLAKPVDVHAAVPWPDLYGLFALAWPPRSGVRATVSGETGPPYFNSGVVAVDAAVAPRLHDAWLDAFARITASGVMDVLPFFREQVALAVAVERLGLGWRLLDDRHNWPAHMKPLGGGTPPALVHYHAADVVRREDVLARHVRRLCDEDRRLAAAIAEHPDWAALLAGPRDGRSGL